MAIGAFATISRFSVAFQGVYASIQYFTGTKAWRCPNGTPGFGRQV
jgi:hypothetical protein